MVHIPTTERRFHNVGSKVNSLGVTSQAMLPVAKQYKQTLLEQQKVKIDTLSTKARIDIDNKVNQWRLDNQAKPDDPEAKAQLQTDIQEILSGYGSQIDPIAKMGWDTAANKLSSGYEIAQNQWTLNQRAENAKLDVAENINANLSLAYNSGLAGNELAGFIDLDNSYLQIRDYAAKNMGEIEADKLLTDYKSEFTESYVSGLAVTNPDAALDFLANEDNRLALKYPKKVNTLINLAKAQKVKLKKEREQAAIGEFIQNPTEDGLRNLELEFPDMSKKTYDKLNEIYETSPNFEAVSTFSDLSEAKVFLEEISNIPDGEEISSAHKLDMITDYIRKLQRSNLNGSLSEQDVMNQSNAAYRIFNDNVFKEQVHKIFGVPGTFSYVFNWGLGGNQFGRIENIGKETIQKTIQSLLNNDPEQALEIYKEGQQAAIRVRYPEIPFDTLKEGDVFWYGPTSQAFKFMGYGLDDILVEVDPNSGVKI